MRWILFVASRLLSRRGRSSGISTLSALGIAAGVMTLVAVLGVMNGFQLTTIESILELGSFHLQVELAEGGLEAASAAAAVVRETTGVRSAAPYIEIQTLARGFWPEPQGVALRIVPRDWLTVDRGAQDILTVEYGAFDLEGSGTVVLGNELAVALGVRVGDPIHVMYIADGAPRDTQLLVTGIVRSGYLDYDRAFAWVSFETATTLLGVSETPVLGIKLTNRFDLERAIPAVASAVSTVAPVETTVSWREYNAGIFGALKVEKTVMILMVGLIFLVVGTNIFQALRRGIFERAEDIAILRALGAPAYAVRLVFVLEGAIIGIGGAFAGTATGLFLAYNINGVFAVAEGVMNGVVSFVSRVLEVPLEEISIFSPAYFYLIDVPVTVFPGEAVGVAGAAVVASLAAAYWAARKVGTYRPSEILRDE